MPLAMILSGRPTRDLSEPSFGSRQSPNTGLLGGTRARGHHLDLRLGGDAMTVLLLNLDRQGSRKAQHLDRQGSRKAQQLPTHHRSDLISPGDLDALTLDGNSRQIEDKQVEIIYLSFRCDDHVDVVVIVDRLADGIILGSSNRG